VRLVVGALPYAALPDPLTAAGNIDLRAGLEVRWGAVNAGGSILLPSSDTPAIPSGWPRRVRFRPILPDQGADGTSGDTDADGTRDWDEWWLDPDDTMDDPWFAALARGPLVPALPPSQSDDQPWPFDPAEVPAGPRGPWQPDLDRSNLVQLATMGPVP